MADSSKKKPAAKQTPPKKPARPTPAGSVFESIDWYRAQYQRLMKAVMVLGVALVVAVVGIVISLNFRQEPRYFAVSKDFKVVQLRALSSPIFTDNGVLNWFDRAVSNTLALDFVHWQSQLKVSRKYFSQGAFNSLTASMRSMGFINFLTQNHMVLNAVVVSQPMIENEGMYAGAYAWKLAKMKVDLRFMSASGNGQPTDQTVQVSALIQRVPSAINPYGIEIKQLVMQ